MCATTVRILTWSFAIGALVFGDAESAHSQEPGEVDYRVGMVSPSVGGVYAYRRGQWGRLNLTLTNPHERDLELLCATSFDVAPKLQYGRRVWVPARSRLMISHPIHLPELETERPEYGFHTVLMESDGSDEVLIRDDSGKMELAGSLPTVAYRPVTGMIIPRREADSVPAAEVSPWDWVQTLRIDQSFTRRVTILGDEMLPTGSEGLDALDQLVVADDRVLNDAAALSAIRRWLHDGGRVWVMQDRVDPRLPEMLLGDECDWQVVDTVTLTHLQMTSVDTVGGTEEHELDFEEAVDMVRVTSGDARVWVSVNGWPALFTKGFGAGTLMVSTLSSTAWVRPRTSAEQLRTQDPERQTPWIPIPAGRSSFVSFFGVRAERPGVTSALGTELGGYVGYSVPARGAIVGVLAAFTIGVFGLGLWMRRLGRVERLVWCAPGLALLVATGLAAAGRVQQTVIPPVSAVVELVEPIGGTDEAAVIGVAGLYATESGTLQLGGSQGGWAIPDSSGAEGAQRRLIWSDEGTWDWENFPQSPGIREARFQFTQSVEEPLVARGAFDPEGIKGRLHLPATMHPRDAVVMTPTGRLAVELAEDGSFAADSGAVLGMNQFVSAELLDDDQARRSRMLAELLKRDAFSRSGSPLLLLWTDPWDEGLRWDERAESIGAALCAIPLLLERPVAGTEVVLPQPLLSFREATGPDGFRPTGLFDNLHRTWTLKTAPSTTWLRFEVPEVLLPAEPVRARIAVRVTGPMGRLQLGVDGGGSVAPIGEWIDPVGEVAVELEDPAVLTVSPEGHFYVRIEAGVEAPPEPEDAEGEGTGRESYWQIESIDVQMRVRVLDGEAVQREQDDPKDRSTPERGEQAP